MKIGECSGRSPFAGNLRACPELAEGVSLRKNSPPSWPEPALSLPKGRGSGGWSSFQGKISALLDDSGECTG